jgi:hypothetical protein
MHVNTPCVDVLSGLKDESCLGDVHRYCDARFWFHEKLTKRGFRINAVENVEKAMKQVEDMKKLNAQLTEKLTAATQATSGAGGTEDLKRKLEATGRLAAVHKKEAETFRAKMETTVKEEARLRSEVTKLQAEMKRMKALSGMTAAAAAGQPAAVGVKKPGGPGGKAA